ncbi:YciI family protein [Streptomyces sp. 4N509B]|uniref:YciI family protein n=1 Tax=Streptomyces sp. 4N509B TaxID=3457413 RepID=UPI003FD396C5
MREDEARKVYSRMALLPFFAVFMRPTALFDWSTDEGELLMREHLRWQLALEDEGRLLAAGPLNYGEPPTEDDPIVNAGSMFILAARSREEAEDIVAQDPFVLRGWRTHAIRTWLLNEGVAREAARPVSERFGNPFQPQPRPPTGAAGTGGAGAR